MTGPEHYCKAETILDALGASLDLLKQGEGADEIGALVGIVGIQVAAAQAHATLALAAATAEPWAYETSDTTGVYLRNDWVEALS